MLVIAAPSYSVNIFVAKPMAVTATFFFFIHTLIKLNYKKSLSSHLSVHKPLAEYTRLALSNIRSYGGVCIMPTAIVRVVLFIFNQYNSVLPVIVVEPCPIPVFGGDCGGIPPAWAELRCALHERDFVNHI